MGMRAVITVVIITIALSVGQQLYAQETVVAALSNCENEFLKHRRNVGDENRNDFLRNCMVGRGFTAIIKEDECLLHAYDPICYRAAEKSGLK